MIPAAAGCGQMISVLVDRGQIISVLDGCQQMNIGGSRTSADDTGGGQPSEHDGFCGLGAYERKGNGGFRPDRR